MNGCQGIMMFVWFFITVVQLSTLSELDFDKTPVAQGMYSVSVLIIQAELLYLLTLRRTVTEEEKKKLRNHMYTGHLYHFVCIISTYDCTAFFCGALGSQLLFQILIGCSFGSIVITETEAIQVSVNNGRRRVVIFGTRLNLPAPGHINPQSQQPVDVSRIPLIPKTYVESEFTETQCTICTEDYEEGEDITRLECDHIFHPQCIDKWIRISPTCPNCRSELLRDGGTETVTQEPSNVNQV